jgi:hypothetical protein
MRHRVTKLVLAGLLIWVLVSVCTAGVKLGQAQFLPAGWGSAAGVLLVGTVIAVAISRGWRPRT